MIEILKTEDRVYAIIVRANFQHQGIVFFTPDDFSQQLGYMNREKGYVIPPHLHTTIRREVTHTNEVLFIKQGRVRVDFYDEQKDYIESRIVSTGDVLLLASGGHGFEMLETSEIIEVKQGPYSGDLDKIRFEATPPKDVKCR